MSTATSTETERPLSKPQIKSFDRPLVLEPFSLRGVDIPNRLWVAPMGQHSAMRKDGVPTDWQLVHLGQFAIGGAGLILTESVAVSAEGKLNLHGSGIWTDEQAEGWRRVTAFVHSQNARIGIQLAHGGRKSSTYPSWGTEFAGRHGKSASSADGGWQTVAPSPIAAPGLEPPRELTLEEVRAIPGQFAAAARRAVAVGFDLIEIHAAHGFLLHQFLSALTNQRTDEYGGSVANRARLLDEITAAIRVAIGEQVPIFVRLSATDWAPGGLDLEQTVAIVESGLRAGADLFDVSTGGNVPAVEGIPVHPGYQVRFASEIKRMTGAPVAAVGVIVDGLQAEQIMRGGAADAVFVGRQFMRDPYFARHAAEQLKAVSDIFIPPQYSLAYRQERW